MEDLYTDLTYANAQAGRRLLSTCRNTANMAISDFAPKQAISAIYPQSITGALPDTLNVLAAGRRAGSGRSVTGAEHGQQLAAWLSLLRVCTALPHRLARARPLARAGQQQRASSAVRGARISTAIELGVNGDVFGRAPAPSGCACAPCPLSCSTQRHTRQAYGQVIQFGTFQARIGVVEGRGRGAEVSWPRIGHRVDARATSHLAARPPTRC